MAIGAIAMFAWSLPSAAAGPRTGTRAAATESPEATRAALRILRSSGTAADAAVAAALVAGVSTPTSSGIGGGGFALVWSGHDHTASALDFRETAPRGIDANALEQRPVPSGSRGKLVGVPGEVKGLFELHRRFGKLSWAEVVKPAIETATGGFAVSPHMATTLRANVARLALDAGLATLFTPGGHALGVGVHVRNRVLGRTLERLSAEGPRAIYEGAVAADLVNASANAGGALTQADLDAYRPLERTPLRVPFDGREVITMPAPSAGGLLIAETLLSVDPEELRRLEPKSGAYHHLLGEIFRGAFADRMRFLGDPDFEHLDVPGLLRPERLQARRRASSPDRTRSLPLIAQEEHGTHHLVVADADGNVVSLTTTVNDAFGAAISGPASGVVLNDQLDDFTTRAGVGALGLTASPNRPRPGARPVSSMAPTLVLHGNEPELDIGGSGGLAIPVSVTEVLLLRLVHGYTPAAAVAAPRFGIPLDGSTISLDAPFPEALESDLARRGEIVSKRTKVHAVQLIAFGSNGQKTPAADHRKSGSAAAE